MESLIRDKVLETFERHRATPGAPFDESRFLDFLIDAPKKPRAIHDSFGGLRRFNGFLDELQMEFAVCFSLKDRELSYSLEQFVERIAMLQRSRRSSLQALSNQIKAGAGSQVLVVGNLLLLIAAAGLRKHTFIVIALVIVAVAANFGFFLFARRSKSYLIGLRNRIETMNDG